MTPALTRLVGRLTPACAVELDRFVATFGEDDVVEALAMTGAHGPARLRRAIIRAWLEAGMRIAPLARLLGCDRKTVRNAMLPERARKQRAIAASRAKRMPFRLKPAPKMVRPTRIDVALAETRAAVAALRRSA